MRQQQHINASAIYGGGLRIARLHLRRPAQ
jgi:hypothetical protein